MGFDRLGSFAVNMSRLGGRVNCVRGRGFSFFGESKVGVTVSRVAREASIGGVGYIGTRERNEEIDGIHFRVRVEWLVTGVCRFPRKSRHNGFERRVTERHGGHFTIGAKDAFIG